jgi:aldose sugar dehydrogenase
VLLDNIPAWEIHNGGIIAFAPDKTLYIGVGVANEIMEKSQDTNYLGGKILRINRDGTIPMDNPFPNSPVYSYGHRNIFGLAFHPETKKLYISEPGPDKDDEINIIEKGGNYGWPEVTGVVKDSRFVDPIITYTPTITPTQCCFLDNDFYFGSYNEGTVHKLTLDKKDPAKVLKDDVVYRGKTFGVIGVFCAPDKTFYITTPNRILSFQPKVI